MGRGPVDRDEVTRVREELELVLLQEEVTWCQKSCLEWIASGDRNTKFFHLRTLCRRKRNIILMLKNTANEWVEDQDELKAMAMGVFQLLYTDEGGDLQYLPADFPLIESSLLEEVDKSLTSEEMA
ncbi:unnamed protein product [Linum trigynum]|uniref:Uncharacterized protein n=1 Tax=Linum trigynum TaxID=586398 RepID=A0AAV2F5P1_9ROSI